MHNKRLEYEKPCPHCGEQMQYFDDEDNGAFWGLCMECWEEDTRDYYKDEDGEYVLLKKEDAIKKHYISECKKCKAIIYPWESENDICIMCNAEGA